MVYHLGKAYSVAHTFLYALRNVRLQTDRERFRENVKRLGELMAYEISKQLRYKNEKVTTPLGTANASLLEEEPVLIAVLRAGLPYYAGFQHMFPEAPAGFIGAYRKEGSEEVEILLSYMATPSLEGRTVLLIDPMLATGKSFVRTARALMQQGLPAHVHIAALVGAPEGLDYLQKNFPLPHDIWLWALDDKLNDQYYIVPGLGDAGDLCFGEKI
ncbi:MAG: uracil phosphoribosyltransferase [Cyclobacteriaceae bacterium]|nr:uracil phosphoribosyltransferase [Cyclobacteriaceae bacterium]MDW8330276.1 uracil phosphoribosyltransferase [Cyclobacteriaceae bacterium]